jgi:mannan endo-1,4-beta-mannosidase
MRPGLPVRRALAALVPLAVATFLVVELAGFGGSSLPVPRQGSPACRAGCRYVGVALAHMGEAPLRTFERLSGVKPQIEENYWSFDQPFPSGWARTLLRDGILPLLQINPRRESLAAIAAGRYDPYLRRFAAEVRALRAPVALSFAHEMNGSWYPWGFLHVQPGVFVAAWRHIHDVLGAAGARRVIWVWTVAHTTPQAGRLFAPVGPYWPGAGYVNWVGLDIYYSNPRTTFRTAFMPTIGAVRRFTRNPILLSETAVPNQYDQLQQINNLFAGARAARLLGVIWYDQDARMSWELNNRPAALAAFRRDAQQFRQAGRGTHAST